MEKIKSVGLLLLIGVLAIGLAACTFEQSTYSPEQVINNAMQKEAEPISYYGEANLTMKYDDEMLEMSMNEWHSPDGKIRLEIEPSEDAEETIIVYDGEEMQTYSVETNELIVMGGMEVLGGLDSSPREQSQAFLEMITDTHELEVIGEDTIAKRKVYQIKARTDETDTIIGDVEIWVDKENWFVLKVIANFADSVTELEYSKIDYKPEIEDDLFTIELEEDVEIIDLGKFNDSEEITLAEVSDLLGKEYLLFEEGRGLAIEKVSGSTFNMDNTEMIDVTLEYTKDDIPFLTLEIGKISILGAEEELFPEDMSEDDFLLDGVSMVELRSKEGYIFDLADMPMLSWEEGGLDYTVIMVDPELSVEDIQVMAEEMVLVE